MGGLKERGKVEDMKGVKTTDFISPKEARKRGTWVAALSVKHLMFGTLGFGLGCDLRVLRLSVTLKLSVESP